MDIVIKTGFEKITHAIQFQPQTPSKGKDLANIGHVRDVEERRQDKVSYLIQANVVRQVSVTKPPYAVKLKINENRFVYAVSCTCVYNKSNRCKHIYTLIHYINNHESLSKTSFHKQWGNPTARQFAQEKYSKGASFETMFKEKKVKINLEPPPLNILDKINHSCPIVNLLLVPTISNNKNSSQKLMISNPSQEKVIEDFKKCNDLLNKVFKLYEQHVFYKVVVKLPKEVKDFYIKFIILASRYEIIRLCCDTLSQSDSDKWYAARRLRISASKSAHSIKTRKTKSIESVVEDMLYPKKVETTATRYGKKYEKHACKEYQRLYGVHVQQCGLVICEEQPWLCASPDGIVIQGNKIVKVLEIKCPYSCAKLPIVDYKNKKCNVSYLKFKGDTIELRESNIYFTQCQVLMYVTGTENCDLMIYSPIQNGSCCVQVQRNEEFLKATIRVCEHFYFDHYLPKLYYKIVVEPNENIPPKRTFTGVNIVNTV